MPQSRLGAWSVGLIVAFLLLLAAFHALVASGQRGGDTIFDNLILGIPGMLMFAAAVGAFFTGITGIIKSRERAAPVFLATLVGLFVLAFSLGEVLVPH